MGGADRRGKRTSVLLEWNGTLPRFAPVMEGGPGRPAVLAVQVLAAVALAVLGQRNIEREGIGGFGPPVLFLACGWLLFLAFWVLVKGLLRGRDVAFVLSEAGVEVRPSERQRRLDRGMKFLSHLVFLLTFRGGTWSAWHPFTAWKDVRRAEFDDVGRTLRLWGGGWTIRLVCGPGEYEQAAAIVRERLPVPRLPASAARPKRPAASRLRSARERDREDTARPTPTSGVPVWRWWMRIGAPLTLLAVGVGVAGGFLRAKAGFVPGIHGMLIGGVLAAVAARCARPDDAAAWGGGQRFWLWLNLTLTCGFASLTTLSILRSPPLGGTWEWLSDVAAGLIEEPFFGARAVNPIRGLLGGGWWIGLNALDLALCFFVGIVALGAAVQSRIAVVDAPTTARTPSRPARVALVVQWLLVALALVAWKRWESASNGSSFSLRDHARLATLEGRYGFDDGQNLLATRGRAGTVRVEAAGGGGLVLHSEPEGGYTLFLNRTGSQYSGRLYRGGSMLPVRVRFSDDGRELQLSGPTYGLGRRQADALVTARRVPEAAD